MVRLGATATIAHIQTGRTPLDWRRCRTRLWPGRSSSQYDCPYQVRWWPDFPPSGCSGCHLHLGSQCPSHSASTCENMEKMMKKKKPARAVIPHGADDFLKKTLYWHQTQYTGDLNQICSRFLVVYLKVCCAETHLYEYCFPSPSVLAANPVGALEVKPAQQEMSWRC